MTYVVSFLAPRYLPLHQRYHHFEILASLYFLDFQSVITYVNPKEHSLNYYNFDPHCPQNAAPVGLENPHLGQAGDN